MSETLKAQLAKYGQEHLLQYWNELGPFEQGVLAEQIESLDLELVSRLTSGGETQENWAELAQRAESPPAVRLNGSGANWTKADAVKAGEQALRGGQVAALLVAGGQGTRLGFPHPKGMFPIGPLSARSLFQIHSDLLQAICRRYNVAIPLFVMTSPATHAPTVAFFEEQGAFGLSPSDIRFFTQGMMPAVNANTGKLLLEDRGLLALSPDGHGGMLAALAKSGGLDELIKRGIRQIFYFQVDNPLSQVCDPYLLGCHLLAGSEMTTQVVAKRDPLERVGNVVQVDGQTRIIEYSDLSSEAAQRRNEDGSLALWAGNIAVHVMDVDFLRRMATQADSLPFHVAKKKVAYLNDRGMLEEPEKPNAIKFERFIFDLMPAAKQSLVVEVDPAEAFAPVKNADGAPTDTPFSARQAMMHLHRKWLEQAGAEVEPGTDVEINPMFALDVLELKKQLRPALRLNEPRYFS